ncbi:MAG: preprotein translocase subunit SecY [Candidatus Wallbacteria bacterium HGW-Wallbacteria-1]|uniref:Protein translocase subunit SecY n=1 Tax=Candidatus Wallbacteria bacterium HGW-Wallbacteria-1 TaxID=2013854 RepID=A0A2N1PSW1_9BACT|nr:MAG: preprotein translocase subunit SecY [Candidatus Wallbacteria bacterium HGW-Wallbacteria-1]
MFQILRDAFKIPELRKRILFTLAMIAVYRLGAHIPTPGIDAGALDKLFGKGGMLGFLDMFSGGALKRFSIFALGIAPYINASIIMQLLVYVIPFLEKLAKEGESGRKKISQYTRQGTIVLGVLQSFGISFMLDRYGVRLENVPFWVFSFICVLTLTAGTAFIMWLGEKITERGIGNGISLLIFAGIVASFPGAVAQQWAIWSQTAMFLPKLMVLGGFAIVVIAGIVFIQDGQRKIPVQYAKKVVGRKVYGGQSTYIPLKVNQPGVIPIIFAVSIMLFPGMIAKMLMSRFQSTDTIYRFLNSVVTYLQPPSVLYFVLYCLLIIFFSYFYTAITLNPKDLADNMKKYGGFIPGIRAGRPTADYIDRILMRITLAGAVFLAVIAVLPEILVNMANIQFYFGGTGLLIVVGVALDTVKQIESHMLTRHYEGFMKKKSTFLR